MRISRSLTILATVVLAACAAQAQLPERTADESLERMIFQPKDALKIHLGDRLDLGLFALDAQAAEAIPGIPELSRDLLDSSRVISLMGSIGCGACLHWTY